MVEERQDWFFTFGWGQPNQNCYTVIHGTHDGARLEMVHRYGWKWCGQYESADDAGVAEFELAELK
jgi:hypothetical protein